MVKIYIDWNARFSPEDSQWKQLKTSTYFVLTNVKDGKKASVRPEVLQKSESLRKGGKWPAESWPHIEVAVNSMMDLILECFKIPPRSRPTALKLVTTLE